MMQLPAYKAPERGILYLPATTVEERGNRDPLLVFGIGFFPSQHVHCSFHEINQRLSLPKTRNDFP